MSRIVYRLWIACIITCFVVACKTVPGTGHKQLNLVPDFMIRELALTQYDSFVRVSPTLH